MQTGSLDVYKRQDMASIVDSLVAPLSVINALIVALCMMQTSDFFRNPVGTGPYKIESWDEGQAITLVTVSYTHLDVYKRQDMNRANEVRPVFRKLGMSAEKTGCAIVLIGHLNKSSGTQSTYRGLDVYKRQM